MYIIQHTGYLAPELKGEVISKGKTKLQAINKMIKELEYTEETEITYDEFYVYVDGDAGFRIEKI